METEKSLSARIAEAEQAGNRRKARRLKLAQMQQRQDEMDSQGRYNRETTDEQD